MDVGGGVTRVVCRRFKYVMLGSHPTHPPPCFAHPHTLLPPTPRPAPHLVAHAGVDRDDGERLALEGDVLRRAVAAPLHRELHSAALGACGGGSTTAPASVPVPVPLPVPVLVPVPVPGLIHMHSRISGLACFKREEPRKRAAGVTFAKVPAQVPAQVPVRVASVASAAAAVFALRLQFWCHFWLGRAAYVTDLLT
eukprot:365153-Chlamydomonas_euryale.AAC.1